MPLWTPADLTTPPLVWLDGADNATITLNGSTVSAWGNKGSLGGSSVQATTTSQPARTGSHVVFDGVNDSMSFPQVSGSWTLLIVNKDAETAGDTTRFAYLSNAGGTEYVPIAAAGEPDANNLRLNGVSYNGVSARINGTPTTLTNRASAFTALVTGARKIVSLALPSGLSSTAAIGGHAQFKISGETSEVLAVSGTLSASDTEKLEGYLAHKWGLADSLPADHPYKTAAPQTGDGTPNPVTGTGAASGAALVLGGATASGAGSLTVAAVTGTGAATGQALSLGPATASGSGSLTIAPVTGVGAAAGRALSFGTATSSGTGSHIAPVTGIGAASGQSLTLGVAVASGAGAFSVADVAGDGAATGRALSFGPAAAAASGIHIAPVIGTAASAHDLGLVLGAAAAAGAAQHFEGGLPVWTVRLPASAPWAVTDPDPGNVAQVQE